MSYYHSKFYQRWFTMNMYSPFERNWWRGGMVAGTLMAGVFSVPIRNSIMAFSHNSLLSSTLVGALWVSWLFVFSEGVRRIGRRREESARTQQATIK